jgi:serum/glucocorticoid-regulated kinase 2
MYRDMKPENILIASDGYIRLTDFGLSKENHFSMSFCGSPAYLSPEMLEKKGVGLESDIYGIGTVLFEMMMGDPPFFDDDMNIMFENIKNGKLRYPSYLSI